MARLLGSESRSDQQSGILPQAGAVLEGRFELLELVGMGGMGAVYRARDRAYSRVVALKLLAVDDQTCLRRFRREFRAASRLEHEGIATVLGYHAAARPFFTMEFVPGLPLDRWVGLGEGPALNRPERLARLRDALRQLLSAVGYIHSQDLVHRDLKPENVLVTDQGQIKLMDFGVVRGPASSAALTQGRIVGTLAYMSPEQLEGRAVDGRSDLYSLGAILFELLTGEPPFEEGKFGSLARAILETMPPHPRSLNPGVDPALAACAMTLLGKKPWQRFASAAEVLGAIDSAASAIASVDGMPPLLTPQFVGREAETAYFRDQVESLAHGRGGFAFVVGAPGLGKTRLVEEVAAWARSRHVPVLGAGGGGMVGELVELSAGADPESREAVQEMLAAPVDAATAVAGTRAFLRLLARLAAGSGALIVIDDAGAQDPAGLELLRALAQELVVPAPGGGAPLAVMVVLAHGEAAPARSSALGRLVDLAARLRIARQFVLMPLAAAETAAVVRSMLGESVVPAALAAWVQRESEGCPYLAVETVRHLVEEGYLVRGPGHLTLDWGKLGLPPRDELEVRDFDGLPPARGIRDLVERQLGKLAPRERDLLATGAAVGVEFEFDLLLRAGAADEDEVMDGVQALLRARLLMEVRESRDRFRFAHLQVREILLQAMSDEERSLRHGAIARALEERPETARDPVALARHWDQAGLGDRARDYLPAAAELLSSRRAHAEAAEAWTRWLDLSPGDAPGGERARLRLAGELSRLGRNAEARLVLTRLLQQARPSVERAALLGELAEIEARLGNFGQAVLHGCEMVALGRAGAGPAEQARAHLVLGQAQMQHGHLGDAERSLQEAQDLYRRSGSAVGLASAQRLRAAVARQCGRLNDAAELVQGALAQCRGFAEPGEELLAVLELGWIALERGHLEQAIESFRQALAAAEEQSDPAHAAIAHEALGAALTLAGDHGEAERALARCLRHVADEADAGLEASALLGRALVRRIAGDLAGAMADVGRARQALSGVVHVGLEIRLLLEEARIQALSGHALAARRLARRALALARANRLPLREAHARLELAESMKGAAAREQAGQARDLARTMGAEWIEAQALARAAAIEEELGERLVAEASRAAAARILRSIARRLGPRERMFLRTPVVRAVIGAQPTVVGRGLGPRATTRR